LAALHNSNETAKVLLVHGADLNSRNNGEKMHRAA
jgi:hypothetical protein